jgi:transposase
LGPTGFTGARVLCAFGSAMQPEPTPPLSAQQKRLRELETQRQHLSRMTVAEQNRLSQLNDKELQRLTRRLLATLKKQMAAIDSVSSASSQRTKPLPKKRKNLPPLQALALAPLCCCLRECPS